MHQRKIFAGLLAGAVIFLSGSAVAGNLCDKEGEKTRLLEISGNSQIRFTRDDIRTLLGEIPKIEQRGTFFPRNTTGAALKKTFENTVKQRLEDYEIFLDDVVAARLEAQSPPNLGCITCGFVDAYNIIVEFEGGAWKNMKEKQLAQLRGPGVQQVRRAWRTMQDYVGSTDSYGRDIYNRAVATLRSQLEQVGLPIGEDNETKKFAERMAKANEPGACN